MDALSSVPKPKPKPKPVIPAKAPVAKQASIDPKDQKTSTAPSSHSNETSSNTALTSSNNNKVIVNSPTMKTLNYFIRMLLKLE
jgi:hypothetical protein